MSEFSKLTTKLITPALKSRGFLKHGKFDQSPTHDSAIYRRGDIEVTLTFAFHPYDYPEVGIRLRTCNANSVVFDRLYPPAKGGIEAIFEAVLKDIELGATMAEPIAAPDRGGSR